MREQFLKAIASDPLDLGIRRIYADWLDEQGEHDEAEAQRSWTLERLVSRKWMLDYAKANGMVETTVEDMLAAGHRSIDDPGYPITVAGHTLLGEEAIIFWYHWSIITGRSTSKTLDEPDPYRGYWDEERCAC